MINRIQCHVDIAGGGRRWGRGERRLTGLLLPLQLHVAVLDRNDSPPSFRGAALVTAVSEDLPVGHAVATLGATDPDTLGELRYQLLGAAGSGSFDAASVSASADASDAIADADGGAGHFELDAVSGVLRLRDALDRETKDTYRLAVRASDGLQHTDAVFTVKVTDSNDNPPVFSEAAYSFDVPENAARGARVGQVVARDDDQGVNGQVTYSVVSDWANDVFSLHPQSGVFTLTARLDYEEVQHYIFVVQAQDSGRPSLSSTLTVYFNVVDLNDNAPLFDPMSYSNEVFENVTVGTSVVTVSATDLDSGDNGRIEYSITTGDETGDFVISPNGSIWTRRPLDRETKSLYNLVVTAEDQARPPQQRLSSTVQVTIVLKDVNDAAPEFITPNETAVAENVPPNTVVMAVKAVDRDEGRNSYVEYSLAPGPDSALFTLGPVDGLVRVAGRLDREARANYTLEVTARDRGDPPRASRTRVLVRVLDENDNSPVFDPKQYSASVPENASIGASVLQNVLPPPDGYVVTVRAHDADTPPYNGHVRYFLKEGDADLFRVNASSGEVSLLRALDREAQAEYVLALVAMDTGTPPLTGSGTVRVVVQDVNDHSPEFERQAYEGVVRENLPAGTSVLQPRARDRDAGLNARYEVWVEARDSDSPPLRSVLRLLINVTDANDNAPVMERALYNASIPEEETPPQRVVRVSATDADSGTNGQVTYRLVDDGDGAFEMDADTGDIFTAQRLDRESVASYSLTVQAIDRGTPALVGSATVVVTVLDKNDNPPRFTRLFSVNVTENAEPGTFVIRITSSDLDVGENANATYSFTDNPDGKFAVDAVSGNVTVVGPLDREHQDEYLLKVVAVDGSWRAETPLTITIQDQNDNAPEFEHSFYSFNFPELQRSVVFVGQVVAADRDKQGPNAVISYALKHPSDLFTVDPASGELFSKRSLRYKHTALEASPENEYVLTVTATDNGKPPMSSECLVTVNVVDANNNAPVFEREEYFSPVPESAVKEQRVLRVTATDEGDFGINAEVQYQRLGGNGSELFDVARDTGWITVLRPLRGRLLQRLVLRVRAQDRGVPPQHADVTVTLVVAGDNRHAPVFTALSYQVLVPENEPLGATILTVSAADSDQGPNGMVRYAISGGNERGEFAVDAVSGAVTIQQPLDYDTVPEYHLNITASDLAFEPRAATAMLTVTLTDINDNAPAFDQQLYRAFLPENSPPHSFVFRVEARDADSAKNAVVQYSLVGGSGRDAFSIESKTGVIYSRSSFDYEERSVYALDVVAANPDSPMYGSTRVEVHVTGQNEFYPRFVQPVFHFDVSESAEVGTSVGTVQATDADAGDDGVVYYLFVGASNDRGFSIGADTGTIRVSRRLDRETQNRVVLTVLAKNAGGIRGNDTDEAQVVVSVQDGNDPPEFAQAAYDATVSEAAAPGTRVATVRAVDKDVRPQNNQFSYSIIGGNVGRAFKVDPQTGDVETTARLDRETMPAYTLTVGAIDAGAPPQTGTATLRISVLDVNDNGPVLEAAGTTGYVAENEPAGTSVLTLSATDPDLPPNGAPFTYRLVGGRHRDLVAVEPHTGVVKTTRSLDREATPTLDLLVEVEDSGEPRMKAQHAVSVVVLDQNDSPSTPRVVHVLVHVLDEPSSGGAALGRIADVHPNDADSTGESARLPVPAVLSVDAAGRRPPQHPGSAAAT
ncbi:Fat-like cadherin-related tumor suppressor homolog [Gryllus bimaculatus]|nr:Fat-like cadherin-related tumor suppressor homolog [Gryllus bimaculatus]